MRSLVAVKSSLLFFLGVLHHTFSADSKTLLDRMPKPVFSKTDMKLQKDVKYIAVFKRKLWSSCCKYFTSLLNQKFLSMRLLS